MYIKPDNLNHCTLACQQQLVSSITSEKETKKKKKKILITNSSPDPVLINEFDGLVTS